MNSHGILILGHGTPSTEGTRSFLEIVELVKAMAGETTVDAGFMEFASPTIADGAAALQALGVTQIAAVPVFLSGVGHTANDIPPAVDEARSAVPDVTIQITPHVGSHPKIAELSALRYREAIAGRPEIPEAETVAVLVAHGSPEPEALAELDRFAAARRILTPVGRIVPCFSQMGEPLLKEIISTLAEPGVRRIVVQPHFLLAGRFIDAIKATVAAAAVQLPNIDWVVTAPLGAHRLLAEAAFELGTNAK